MPIFEDYLKMIVSMSVGCQMGQIDQETYIQNLEMTVQILKERFGKKEN